MTIAPQHRIYACFFFFAVACSFSGGGGSTGPETAMSPSVMPESAIAASASKQEEPWKAASPRQREPQQAVPGNNIWWVVGAGIAALLVILVLANV